MRQIKFRAWDSKGEYFKPLEDDGDYYFRDDGDGLCLYDKWGECKDTILLQFTGLKDKNGKEIYEGDIVILPDTESHSVDVGIGPSLKVAETSVNTIAAIKFINGGFVFEVPEGGENWEKGITSFHNTDYTIYRSLDNSDLEKEIEVIGNIYENPELLK